MQNNDSSSTIAPLSHRPIWWSRQSRRRWRLIVQHSQPGSCTWTTCSSTFLFLNCFAVHVLLWHWSAFNVDERFQFLNFSSHVPVLMKYDLSVLFMWYLLDYLLSVTFLDAVNVCMFSSSISVFRQSPSMGSCRTEQQKFLLWRFHKYIIPPIPIYDQNCPPWKKSVKSCEHLNRPV